MGLQTTKTESEISCKKEPKNEQDRILSKIMKTRISSGGGNEDSLTDKTGVEGKDKKKKHKKDKEKKKKDKKKKHGKKDYAEGDEEDEAVLDSEVDEY